MEDKYYMKDDMDDMDDMNEDDMDDMDDMEDEHPTPEDIHALKSAVMAL